MKTAFLVVLTSFLLVGCYYDKAELVYPATTPVSCDTSNISFSADVLPLINAKCNSCHGGTAAAGGGIVLSTYAGIKAYATNGKLINSVLQNGLAIAMPVGGTKLTTCEINKLNAWIHKGQLNN